MRGSMATTKGNVGGPIFVVLPRAVIWDSCVANEIDHLARVDAMVIVCLRAGDHAHEERNVSGNRRRCRGI